jgi:hypothetical protein
MQTRIEIQLNDHAPATFELVVRDRTGHEVATYLAGSGYADESRDAAFDALLERARGPLPRGQVRSLVVLDQWGEPPPARELGRRIGLRLAA